MAKFSFDPLTHTYTVDDMDRVSVTRCLPDIYYSDNREAKLKGKYGHEMCRLYLLNDLNEDTLDDSLRPYLDALKLFLSHSKGMGVVGVIDFKLGAKTDLIELQIPAYIELVNNGVALQESGSYPMLEVPFYHPTYQYCGTPDIVISDGSKVKEGHALYLKDNGKYKLETIPNVRRNFEMFLQFLNTEKWCREHNLKGKD